jgi:hypothetical protein
MVAAAVAMRQIRCLGERRNGTLCDQLLLIVDSSLVNAVYAERIHGKCPRCATVFTLADYRVTRVK